MLKLDVIRMLQMTGHSKYWLWQQTDINSYKNFNRMIENQTQSIRYDILEQLCQAFECTPNDLFTVVDDFDLCQK